MSAKKKLEAQYGKWKAKLNGDAQLKTMLMKEGHEGLEKFGYLSDEKVQGDPNYRYQTNCVYIPLNPHDFLLINQYHKFLKLNM